MSVTKIYVHLVFSTKKRNPLLTKAIRGEVSMHIHKNAKSWGIDIDFVNGYYDHAHCLLKLPSTMNIAQVAQIIKGESSRWINLLELASEYFEWQDDYYAESVSIKDLERVRSYIKNQEQHHQSISFEKEMEVFGK